MNRRKPHDVKIQQQTYIRHLKKIQQLMNGNSPYQRRVKQKNKKILQLMKDSHKLHSLSKSQQKMLKQKSINKVNQNNINTYRNTQSVVRRQISKSIIKLPQRYTKNLYNDQIDRENQKLQNRLLQTKPYVLNKLQYYYYSQRKFLPPIGNTLDFSRLYFQSPNSQYHLKKYQLEFRLSKKPNNKLIFNFTNDSLMKCLKQHQNCFVSVQPFYNGHKIKIVSKTYEKIFKSQFQVYLNYKQKHRLFQLRFYKSFQDKNQNIFKGKIVIDLGQLLKQPLKTDQYYSIQEKVINNEKQLGSVQIKMKIKTLKKKIMHTVRNTIEQQQKQNTQRIKKQNRTEHIENNLLFEKDQQNVFHL